jgi:hypothetical protein
LEKKSCSEYTAAIESVNQYELKQIMDSSKDLIDVKSLEIMIDKVEYINEYFSLL